MSGGANFVQRGANFPKIPNRQKLKGRLFDVENFGRFAPDFDDFPSKNKKNLHFLLPKYHIFRRFAPKMLGGANFSQGALIFQEFSKSEIFWGALVLSENSPEMAGVR